MTGRTVVLTPADVAAFAAASGDVNPLHVDEDFARRSTFGRTIAHGALVTLTGLSVMPSHRLVRLSRLRADFTAPVHPGEPYDVGVDGQAADGDVVIRVECRGELAARIELALTAPQGLASSLPAERYAPRPQRTPTAWTLDALRPHPSWHVPYDVDLSRLRHVVTALDAAHVPEPLVLWLARAGWVTGMHVPGRDGLLTGMTLTPARGHAPVRDTEITVHGVDPRTGTVRARARFHGPEGAATVELRSFLRHPVTPPNRKTLQAHLPAGDRLAGRHVLVAGGSRGLGAALTGALASQGATVWSLYARSDDRMREVQQEFGAQRVRPVRCDVTDSGETTAVAAHLDRQGVVLDGVALTASPPLRPMPLHPQAVPGAVEHVADSLTSVLQPLSALLPSRLPRGSWALFVSSSAVQDPPARWGHYIAAKAALEAYARHCRHHLGLRTLVLRAPKMHTDLVNDPTGRLGAVPIEKVAAACTQWAIDGCSVPGHLMRFVQGFPYIENIEGEV
ncbi:SDR family NAD(P)-dependent oxidoreductase [Streptomyces sp. NPDC006658]|uniref:SDR family NAD(P)-dependent oxidoreductase n=1 Tax=Streptomyces sp. NPDC006658 TaxID=3156900 RepID=UPI0033E2BBAB